MTDHQRELLSEVLYKAMKDKFYAIDELREVIPLSEIEPHFEELRQLENAVIELGLDDAIKKFDSRVRRYR